MLINSITKYAIKLSQAVVLFDQFPALTGVDLEVEQGEALMITGANGAGKTTLLRLLAGLIRLSKGSGEVQGIDLKSKKLDNLHKRVGLVGTHTMFYEDLSAIDNLKFWSQFYADKDLSSKNSSTKKITNTLTYLDLPQNFWHLPVRKLSTGQKKRTVLALQMLKRPSLWLLDEPHAGLDKPGRDILNEVIKNACLAGASAVFVTHEVEQARQLADRQLELKGGRF